MKAERVKILECSCVNTFQDKEYGRFMRVHNEMKDSKFFVQLTKDGKVAQRKEYTTAKAALNAFSRSRGQLRRNMARHDRKVEVIIVLTTGEEHVISSWVSPKYLERVITKHIQGRRAVYEGMAATIEGVEIPEEEVE